MVDTVYGTDIAKISLKGILITMNLRNYISIFLIFLLFLVNSSEIHAIIAENCSNCHTMHNSQNGASMIFDSTPIIGFGTGDCFDCHSETRAVLLRSDCLGCHARNVGGNSRYIANTPQIAYNTTVNDLAAGNYKHVFSSEGGDTRGHNVHGFGNANIWIDFNIVPVNTPPGYDSNYDPSSGGYQDNIQSQIMCAGQNGCHGNRDQVSPILAIYGSHHTVDTILKFGAGFTEIGQGNTVGLSYRFLYKVRGAEDDDWQETVNINDHNEYRGSPFGVRAGQVWGDIDTISEFCAECHGDFHSSGGIGVTSPWIRHPTDVILPASGEYSSYTIYSLDATEQDIIAPIARQSIADGTASASSTVTPGNDIVMCLSCHRAHASPYYKIMRWDYKNANLVRALSGCNVCHTNKD